MTAAEFFIQNIKKLSKRLGIPLFRDLNIGKEQFDRISKMSFENNSTPSNPRKLGQEDYLNILENAYE
jgi:alcohol dehydrogenase class IV